MERYKHWKPLVEGDQVEIIAPSAKWIGGNLSAITHLLQSWGLVARIPVNLYGEDLLSANTDSERFLQLQKALLESEAGAVWAIRGGYGATRLIPRLCSLPAPAQPKLFIGLSDTTALHIFLQQYWGWQTLHAPGASQIAAKKISSEDIEHFKQIVFGQKKEICINLLPLNQGNAFVEADIIGGNLAIVQSSIGTCWQIDTKNKILFLEDVNERGYRVDRMLTQLTQAGLLNDVSAVVFGDFIGGEEANGVSFVEPVLKRFAESQPYPVFKCSGIGHGFYNKALPLGALARIALNKLTVRLPF